MDTLVSHSEHFAISTTLQDIGVIKSGMSNEAIGDNERVLYRNYVVIFAPVKALRIMDSEVNPTKFFISIERDKFWRQGKQPNDIARCLVRAVPCIIWRNLVFGEPILGVSRIYEGFDQ